jgi:DNA-binding transcriptional LysR family regulator
MTDFRTLEAIIWISRLGGFSAAAERMNTTQPAISHRIQQLEAQLGVKIFHRQKPKVTLTDEGRELLKFAEPIVRMQEQMLTALGQSAKLEGRLSIGVTETIVRSWLPDYIKAAVATYPKVELEIKVDDTASLRGRLLAYDIDLAFLSGSIHDPVIKSLMLSQSRMGFVCAPSVELRSVMTASDLAQHPLISFSRTSSMRPVLEAFFSAPDCRQPQLHTSNSLATIVEMALDGIGVAFIPMMVAAQDIANGKLIEVKTSFSIPEIAFSACWLATPVKTRIALAAELAVEVSSGYRERCRS